MINVRIKVNGDKKYIEISGHADSAPYGKDIVCAAVSTVFQVAILGLTHLAKQYKDYIKVEVEED